MSNINISEIYGHFFKGTPSQLHFSNLLEETWSGRDFDSSSYGIIAAEVVCLSPLMAFLIFNPLIEKQTQFFVFVT